MIRHSEQVYCRRCRLWQWLALSGDAECGHIDTLSRRQFNTIAKRLKSNIEDFRREVWIGYEAQQ